MVRGGDEVERAGDVRVPERPDRGGAPASDAPVLGAPARLRRRARLPAARTRELRAACASAGSSFYHVHAPLDMHGEIAPSLLVAQGVGLGGLEDVLPDRRAGFPGGACAIGDTALSIEGLAEALRVILGPEILVHVLTRPRQEAGRVAIAAGGGAAAATSCAASLERGCETYVTGNAATNCVLEFVQAEVREFRRAGGRGGRRAARRDALRAGEAAAAGDGRVVQAAGAARRVRAGRAEVIERTSAGGATTSASAATQRASKAVPDCSSSRRDRALVRPGLAVDARRDQRVVDVADGEDPRLEVELRLAAGRAGSPLPSSRSWWSSTSRRTSTGKPPSSLEQPVAPLRVPLDHGVLVVRQRGPAS